MKKSRSEFEDWIKSEGGTHALAKKLKTSQRAVQHWCAREAAPSLDIAVKIVRLSQGKLSLSDIVNGTRAK